MRPAKRISSAIDHPEPESPSSVFPQAVISIDHSDLILLDRQRHSSGSKEGSIWDFSRRSLEGDP